MKVYMGLRDVTLAGESVDVWWFTHGNPGGAHITLQPRTDILKYSATGFEWGYGGSGPSQLGIALVADVLWPAAVTTHPRKRDREKACSVCKAGFAYVDGPLVDPDFMGSPPPKGCLCYGKHAQQVIQRAQLVKTFLVERMPKVGWELSEVQLRNSLRLLDENPLSGELRPSLKAVLAAWRLGGWAGFCDALDGA